MTANTFNTETARSPLVCDAQTQPDQKESVTRIAIIGAGLTGLMSAQLLEQAFLRQGRAVTIELFEKSAGVGRLATRYKKPPSGGDRLWQFDFGAQFFTAKSEAFQQYLQPWINRKTIEPWQAKVAQVAIVDEGLPHNPVSHIEPAKVWADSQPRYIATLKMTHFGRELAKALTHTAIKYKTRVAPLSSQSIIQTAPTSTHSAHTDTLTGDYKTLLCDEQGTVLGSYDWVICTAPQAQAVELFADTDFAHLQAIQLPQMLACYSLMLGWNQGQVLPQVLQDKDSDILQVSDKHAVIETVFAEHHKPGREQLLPSITLHASNNWAQANVDQDIEQVKALMYQAARQILSWDEDSAPEYVDCHRWRYAATQQPCVSDYIAYGDTKKQWIVTGDWCDEGRIESCFKAASAVVKLITH